MGPWGYMLRAQRPNFYGSKTTTSERHIFQQVSLFHFLPQRQSLVDVAQLRLGEKHINLDLPPKKQFHSGNYKV